jgi:hypothetical protein
MRIFYAEVGDPVLLDHEEGLHALAGDLRAFLDSAVGSAEFRGEVKGDPAPYSEFLLGVRVRKVASGPPGLEIAGDRWLELTASPGDLERLHLKLARASGSGHTHFYAAPFSLILEADESWSGIREG